MSGSGGGYIPPASESVRGKIERAREDERKRLEADVNNMLREMLARFNERDIDKRNERLDEITKVLGEGVDIETILLGGSVAKHTYVDGLSDVDALVIIDRDTTQGVSPQRLLDRLQIRLDKELAKRDVKSVSKGSMAVTITFQDNTILQLLPAIRTGKATNIPNSTGNGWNATQPRTFYRQLSRQNERLNGALVPTIKLVKSLVGDLPKQQQITGYHAEALALDSIKGYTGTKTPKSLLSHVLEHSAKRVMRPIQDITGQSRTVDESLGAANSSQRRLVAQAINGIRRRLDSATSLTQWKGMFGRTPQ